MKQIKSLSYRTYVETDSNYSVLIDLRRFLDSKYGGYVHIPEYNWIIVSIVSLCKSIADDKYYGQ